MNRQDFLQTKWLPYPTAPEGTIVGRISEIDLVHRLLTLQTEPPSPSLRGQGDLECLIAGDWVAIDSQGNWTLLAPNLSGGSINANLNTETLALWSQFKAFVHQFFREQGFLEVITPGLVVCPGTEPSLEVFQTEFVHGSRREVRFLPTSPELHLKKALARGLPQIYEIKPCYRNGEISEHHRPEFTMLEWYRRGANPVRIQQDVQELVHFVGQHFASQNATLPRKIRRVTVAELFQENLNAKISATSAREDYLQVALAAGLAPGQDFSIDDLFFLIFIERIEPHFDRETLTIVEKWPPFQAALARLTVDGWGDRFEVYWQGLELANAFHELNDPKVQRARFEEDLAKKRAAGKVPVPLDEEFLACLQSGMPPASGIALGVERLFMAMFGISSIADLSLFPPV